MGFNSAFKGLKMWGALPSTPLPPFCSHGMALE